MELLIQKGDTIMEAKTEGTVRLRFCPKNANNASFGAKAEYLTAFKIKRQKTVRISFEWGIFDEVLPYKKINLY